MERAPKISEELLEYLEGICPDRSPSLETPDRKIWFNAGRADLVAHLRHLFEEQSHTVIGEQI